MINVETIAEVTYNCCLTDEDEEKVKKYAKDNHCSLREAVVNLYCSSDIKNSIDLYANSDESDFFTQEITRAEEVDENGEVIEEVVDDDCMYIHFFGGNDFAGCEIDCYEEYPNDITREELDIIAEEIAQENGETHSHMAKNNEEDWENESDEENYWDGVWCQWEECSRDEYCEYLRTLYPEYELR